MKKIKQDINNHGLLGEPLKVKAKELFCNTTVNQD